MALFFQNNLLEFLTYIVLAGAFASFWVFENKKVSGVLFVIASLFGLVSNQIEWWFLVSTLVVGACVFWFYSEIKKPYIRVFLFFIITTIAVLLFLHKVPGYNNWQVWSDVKLSEKSASFSFWLNFDKPIIGFLLLLFAYQPVRKLSEWREIFSKDCCLFYGLSILVILVLGLLSSYLVFDPKIVGYKFLFLWSLKMLFFTTIVEELFFRFFIQNNAIKLLSNLKNGKILGLILSSFIFGIFHLPAGILFAALAFLAGLLYGGIYLKTNRLESAILLHFAVNFIHLIFFAYPSLA
ncbi:MAG: CPBP family glutamic-type intramembrane protease [Pseudomonadota bacterium]